MWRGEEEGGMNLSHRHTALDLRLPTSEFQDDGLDRYVICPTSIAPVLSPSLSGYISGFVYEICTIIWVSFSCSFPRMKYISFEPSNSQSEPNESSSCSPDRLSNLQIVESPNRILRSSRWQTEWCGKRSCSSHRNSSKMDSDWWALKMGLWW